MLKIKFLEGVLSITLRVISLKNFFTVSPSLPGVIFLHCGAHFREVLSILRELLHNVLSNFAHIIFYYSDIQCAKGNFTTCTKDILQYFGDYFGYIYPWETSNNLFITAWYYHVTYAFQSKCILYSCLNLKELLVRNRRDIWSLSDSNGIRTHNHLVCKRTRTI